MSLYQKHRPKTTKGLIGQNSAVVAINQFLQSKNRNHALLITGPSGCGKTTIGRILKEELQCGDPDYNEVNTADFKGIDTIRDVRRNMTLSPISGECRIWLIDECHKLTNDAQNALLKLLEDTPAHVYFFLATTDPQKLLKTILTRCDEIKVTAMKQDKLVDLVTKVATKEGYSVSEDVILEIAEAADGSARKALVILEQVGNLKTEEEQLAAIKTTTLNKDGAFELARALMNPRTGWADVTPLLRILKDEEAEGVRYCVLGYARSCMVGKEDKPPNMKFAARAFRVIDIFSGNFYDSKQAGLAAACWEVICC
jgi:DNA polymerase-3 subunit gamma/tau